MFQFLCIARKQVKLQRRKTNEFSEEFGERVQILQIHTVKERRIDLVEVSNEARKWKQI